MSQKFPIQPKENQKNNSFVVQRKFIRKPEIPILKPVIIIPFVRALIQTTSAERNEKKFEIFRFQQYIEQLQKQMAQAYKELGEITASEIESASEESVYDHPQRSESISEQGRTEYDHPQYSESISEQGHSEYDDPQHSESISEQGHTIISISSRISNEENNEENNEEQSLVIPIEVSDDEEQLNEEQLDDLLTQ